MKPTLLTIGILTFTLFALALTSPGQSQTFDVQQYGAVGDGTNLDTAAIQKALNVCGNVGGGTVHFGPGTYLSKPLILRSGATLQLDAGATLQATDGPTDYAKANSLNPESFAGFLNGKKLANVTITGQGTIDGAGARWWQQAMAVSQNNKGTTMARPRMIFLEVCTNVTINGVTLQNAPSFHVQPVNCEQVSIAGVTFRCLTNAPNTEGIDLNMSRHVVINQCTMSVGGENISIQSTTPVAYHQSASEGITITNCTFLHGRGVSIGSLTMGGVSNVVVKNCQFANTLYGIRLKSGRNKGGIVDGVDCENLTMQNVRTPIEISCYNQGMVTNDTAQPVAEGTPVFRNIQFVNVTATNAYTAGNIFGLPESVIRNVVLQNVQIASAGKGLKVSNAQGVQLNTTQITPAQGQPVTLFQNAGVQGSATTSGQ